jgi:thiamine biosynthesis lipoprotein
MNRLLIHAAVIAMLVSLLPGCPEPPPRIVPPLPSVPAAPVPDEAAREVLASASEPAPTNHPFVPERVHGEGKAMGTHVTFAAYTTPELRARAVRASFEAALSEIQRLEDLMTTWRDSEVSRINAAAGTSAVTVSEETFEVIREALWASTISDGTFDITFHTLHGLWRFDEDLDPHPPREEDLRARLPFVNYRYVTLDEPTRRVKITHTKTQIGLGGIAKGYAVDRAARVLSKAGLRSFFVQAGGDLLARGTKPDGSDWQAGVRDPRGPDGAYFAKIALRDHAFSTAGDYERAYIVGKKRYHHILDPRTGHPATACRSVTIWAPTALLADAIDDAVFILGPQRGMQLVESLDDVGAVIVDAQNNVGISRRLRGKLDLVAAPTDGI